MTAQYSLRQIVETPDGIGQVIGIWERIAVRFGDLEDMRSYEPEEIKPWYPQPVTPQQAIENAEPSKPKPISIIQWIKDRMT